MRKGIWVVAILVLVSIMIFADTTTTTVKYVVPQSLAFTITMPALTTIMEFRPATATTKQQAAENQTSGTPIILYTNTGNAVEYYYVSLDSNPASGISHSCSGATGGYSLSCACGSSTMGTGCCNITTGQVKVNATSTAISATQPMWCWGDFYNPAFATTTRTLTSESKAS